ncbi:Ras- protein Rab-31 [Tritrichomonas musculus]|uniref:Ras- protein Rab-31 n=1 Tax=Tritrichomonas musculus TaxID=1915356 RepID=A0ABR2GTG7_9EUKA
METKIAKTVVAGNSGVGKTSIVGKALIPDFDLTKTNPTLGSGFLSGNFPDEKGEIINFQVWDTAGQELYSSLSPIFFKDAIIAILVYDVSQPDTLPALDKYIQILNDQEPSCFKAIVGNKIDLERKVSYSEGVAYSNRVKADFYIETSAYTEEGIKELFPTLALQKLVFKIKPKSALDNQQKDSSERKKVC